jgi:2-C-methyl-D-erythritol 4-phosphate cytidylyltransferase
VQSLAYRGVESHPFDDLEGGAADVDRVPADAQLWGALDQHRSMPSPRQPVRQRRACDAGTRDQDLQRPSHSAKITAMSTPPGHYAVGVVLAAGLGARVGAEGNKAYLPLAGRSMVAWSLDAVTQVQEIARTVLVYRRGERDLAHDTVTTELPEATVELVEGGASRHASEFNVLRHLAKDIESGAVDVVLIHDAARPLAARDMFGTALSVAREFGGAIPALAIPGVVQMGPAGVESTSGRGRLVRVQTPQAFRAKPLLRAYRAAAAEGFDGTDTSSCIEKYTDEQVRTFSGDEANLKVTYAHDVAVAEALLSRR